MANFLKVILFLVLTTAFWGSVGDAFTAKAVDGKALSIQSVIEEDGNVQRNAVQQRSYIPNPHLPDLSDAEIASSGGTIQLLSFPRAQRSYTTESVLSLKDVVERLAYRDGALSLHRLKLFDTGAFYRCHPVCEYYVFTLRRIII